MTRALGLVLCVACSGPAVSTTDGGSAGGGAEAAAGGRALAGGSGTAGTGAAGGASDGGLSDVHIDGRRLLVNGVAVEVRAVAWNPVRKGGTHPGGLDFAGNVERDAAMMADAGFNAVRTYVPLTDRAVLDALQRHGLWVLDTVYAYGGDPANAVVARVQAASSHPAVLAWLVGNEWNYNGLYVGLSQADSRARLNEVMQLIRTVDQRLPIVNVYGELPAADVVTAMPLTDVWAINVYRGISFGDLFTRWASRSTKPMMLGEYGADAWNALVPGEDQAAQAAATFALTREIHRSWSGDGGVAIGGALFEWCDEWWKDSGGRTDVHDVGGIAPGGGPHPDLTFNEEWWGLVDIDRNPRAALTEARRGWFTP
ncbi:MAG: hypothetical protein JNK82_05535 [Myxococcaceae bacterium]|nr:hypothetical protein [Myxococcaceae bacterium]